MHKANSQIFIISDKMEEQIIQQQIINANFLFSLIARVIQYYLNLLKMLRTVTDRVNQIKQFIKQQLKSKNIFRILQEQVYTHEEVLKAIKFALGSNATDYKTFHDVEHHLSVIIYYLTSGETFEEAEELLALQEETLWTTPKYVLYMFQKYLERVMPTNITYYHFIREKQFYTQFIAIKYILVVGLKQLKHQDHIFLKMKTNQKIHFFGLLLDWLITLVFYRCSAIYIKSSCVDPLIFEASLLLSALLGYQGNSILSSMVQTDLQDVVNKMLYIQGFLLSMAIPTKRYLNIQSVINTLRKLFLSAHPQKIVMYLPSYLYGNLIGFIKTPYTTDIIFRLLAYFVSKFKNEREGSETAHVLPTNQDINKEQLVTECWSLLSLLVQEYEIDKSVARQLILQSIDKVTNQSMDRAFILKIARNLHLDLEEENIRNFIVKRNQPYVFMDRIIKPQVAAKNYAIAMQQYFYLNNISEAAKGKWMKIDTHSIWSQIILFNKFEILMMDEFLLQQSHNQHQ